MGKFKFRTGPEGYENVASGQVVELDVAGTDGGLETDTGPCLLEKHLPPSYFAWFDWETIEGSLILQPKRANINVFNDYEGAEKPAEPGHLKDFLLFVEENGIPRDASLAEFFLQIQGIKLGRNFLKRVESGIRFSASYPLDYSMPSDFFRTLLFSKLVSNPHEYAFRTEYWEPLGENIEVFRYAPPVNKR